MAHAGHTRSGTHVPDIRRLDCPAAFRNRTRARVGQCCAMGDEDHRVYLDWLKQCADQGGCLIHAYVLMTNHVHLLV